MDLAFDLDGTDNDGARAWAHEAFAPRTVHPCWHELLVRFAAAREASAMLARELRGEAVAMRGSFDGWAAECIAAYPVRHRSVNPNALGNRKSGEAIASAVAGLTRTGGRG